MYKYKGIALASLILFLCLQILPSSCLSEGNAAISDISYPLKVYDGDEPLIIIDVNNLNIPDSEANFFIQIKMNERLVINDLPNTWQCQEGTSITRQYKLPRLNGPSTNLFTVILYLQNQTSNVSLSEKTFRIDVVKLLVEDLKFDDFSLGMGESKIGVISFRNGGNDIMYNATMLLEERGGIQVYPRLIHFGDVNSFQRVETEIELTVYNVTMGVKEIPLIIAFSDFRGINHEERLKINLLVEKAEARIDINAPSQVAYNSLSLFKTRLLDFKGTPIQGEIIFFKIDEKEVGSELTDKDGQAEFRLTANLMAGPHRFSAYYPGSYNLKSAESSVEFHVAPAETTIKMHVPEETIVSQEYDLNVELLDINGNPLPGSQIFFYLDDSKLGIAETDHKGIAQITFTPEIKGNHLLKAEYNGGDNFISSIVEATINVRAIESKLLFSPPKFALEGTGLRSTANLRGSNELGVPYADLKVEIVLNGRVIESKIYKTDMSGQAVVEMPTKLPGTASIKIIYDGGNKYEPIEGQYEILIISRLLIFLIILSSAILISFIALLRLGIIQRLGDMVGAGAQGLERPEDAYYKTCQSCGEEIPIQSKFCDKCGTQEGEGLQEDHDDSSLFDKKVFKYLSNKGGEISIAQAEKDLGITKKQLLESVERLRQAGKLE